MGGTRMSGRSQDRRGRRKLPRPSEPEPICHQQQRLPNRRMGKPDSDDHGAGRTVRGGVGWGVSLGAAQNVLKAEKYYYRCVGLGNPSRLSGGFR